MAYLLDTDTISGIISRRPNLALARRLSLVPPSEQLTSAITLGELLWGALRRQRQDLLDHIERLTRRVVVLPFDEPAARTYADLRTYLEQTGQPLADADLRIAAIARANDLTLLTGNERHFIRVPSLRVENWLTG